MTKWKVFGIFMGLLGALLAYSGIVGYLSHPQPRSPQLAMGVLSLLICLQSLAGASREAQFWMALALTSVASAYGFLELSAKDPDVFWLFLAFGGVVTAVFVSFFTISRTKGYNWRRKE